MSAARRLRVPCLSHSASRPSNKSSVGADKLGWIFSPYDRGCAAHCSSGPCAEVRSDIGRSGVKRFSSFACSGSAREARSSAVIKLAATAIARVRSRSADLTLGVERPSVEAWIGLTRPGKQDPRPDKQDPAAKRHTMRELGISDDWVYVAPGVTRLDRNRPRLDLTPAAVGASDRLLVRSSTGSRARCPTPERSASHPTPSSVGGELHSAPRHRSTCIHLALSRPCERRAW
jgi:hypothetical protein